ncbi:hypothetical protein PYCCODRAFT_1402874 [Trametes coccinea BRFM310]|uniref:Uncharacterized protein n=1 Tax=Trametes coccinea (strain BRFM310) TaxID=1353009 RepID=A0A1Y2J1P0_TRAC3|nr:hypothetical protein PYCCODRAFT_1402874 [Trametes coccinea BRFM310]
MPSQQYIVHPTDLPYVPTIMRAPSPSSTIGTDYGPDETDFADSELNENEFARKCEEVVGIHRPRPEEEEANRDPLLYARHMRPKMTPIEEKQLFDQVMTNLRAAVKQLEEEELFEQTAVQNAAVALDDPVPSSENLDDILRSLMELSTENGSGGTTAHASAHFTNRSETVTPQWATAAMAAMRGSGVNSNAPPSMDFWQSTGSR